MNRLMDRLIPLGEGSGTAIVGMFTTLTDLEQTFRQIKALTMRAAAVYKSRNSKPFLSFREDKLAYDLSIMTAKYNRAMLQNSVATESDRPPAKRPKAQGSVGRSQKAQGRSRLRQPPARPGREQGVCLRGPHAQPWHHPQGDGGRARLLRARGQAHGAIEQEDQRSSIEEPFRRRPRETIFGAPMWCDEEADDEGN